MSGIINVVFNKKNLDGISGPLENDIERELNENYRNSVNTFRRMKIKGMTSHKAFEKAITRHTLGLNQISKLKEEIKVNNEGNLK